MQRAEYFPQAVTFFDVALYLRGERMGVRKTFRSRSAAEGWIKKNAKPASGLNYRIEETKRCWRDA